VELELVLLKELAKPGRELAAENAAECADRQKEAIRRIDPSGVVGGETTSGHDVVNVWMMLQVLSPSMEHAKESDLCSQMLRIAGELQQCGGTGSEEQIVKQSLVLQSESREFVWQSEDDMKVRHRQQLRSSRCHPSCAGIPLTSGAMPVPARVVRDGLMAAARALITMAAQGRSATSDDGIEHLAMLPRKV
jgi:hypothetical protein